jgi:GrpB-like predicted nucleotidyltransferase (UPF0157 family)
MSDPIIIESYKPEWPAQFRAIAEPIRAALGDIAKRIDHIGSTAVVGLDAKPVIDLQISVAALEPSDSFVVPMQSLGYRFQADNPERTKRYFREPAGQPRIHIHVRQHGSWSEQFALLFRDYLRENPRESKAYAYHKHSLATKYRNDRAAYVLAKDPIIWQIIRRANDWSQEMGWQSGPSDA